MDLFEILLLINSFVCDLGLTEDEAKNIVQTFFHRHLISQISDDRLDIHGIIRDCLREYFKIKDIKGFYYNLKQ